MSPIAVNRMTNPSASFPEPPIEALAHIPGTDGWPLVGSTLQYLADPKGTVERLAERFGPVYRTRVFGQRSITLLGPEANEFVLMDPDKIFSSAHGWGRILGLLFPGGLLLRDFEEHRLHRKALSVAFKTNPMKSYLQALNRGISSRIGEWSQGPSELSFYPLMKQMTLDLAAVSILGDETGTDSAAVKHALTEMVAAIIGVVRFPIPGTLMYRGVKGRDYVADYFSRQIPSRRSRGGDDIFTHLCKATKDDGGLLSPQEIVDHMSFLMMAAHDTLASSLTSFVYCIAKNPDWQEKLREEAHSLDLPKKAPLPYEKLDELALTEMAFKESLRLIPPAPSVLRCAMRDTEFRGFSIPAGARVNINPLHAHHVAEIWPEPDRFDPLRFTDEATRARSRYADIPFGGGAHMCLGMHFAYLQAKCFAYHLLTTSKASVQPNYKPDWDYWPIPKPRDGLRVSLTPIK